MDHGYGAEGAWLANHSGAAPGTVGTSHPEHIGDGSSPRIWSDSPCSLGTCWGELGEAAEKVVVWQVLEGGEGSPARLWGQSMMAEGVDQPAAEKGSKEWGPGTLLGKGLGQSQVQAGTWVGCGRQEEAEPGAVCGFPPSAQLVTPQHSRRSGVCGAPSGFTRMRAENGFVGFWRTPRLCLYPQPSVQEQGFLTGSPLHFPQPVDILQPPGQRPPPSQPPLTRICQPVASGIHAGP